MDLVTVWACLIGLAIILYVVLDGFTLGVALLFPMTESEEERDILMNSVAPIWDANQTWLVLGGGAVFVAFPIAYGILFSALYIPLLTFIFGLIFRGVAFEFRANAGRKRGWNSAFFYGSLVAATSQGLTLGGVISGTEVRGENFAGGAFDWFNPFTLTLGAALITGYVLLGSTFVIMKTGGPVQRRAYDRAFWSAIVVLLFQVVVTVWTPFHYPDVLGRWLNPPRIYFIWIFPVVGLIAFYLLLKSLGARREGLPFFCSVLLFLAGYFGLVASIYPYAVPPVLTFRQTAAQPETLSFAFWGAAIVLPVVLAYTIYSYSIFRGKVGSAEYYH
jgi:cytochrome bd ubiquinol oxidase subunit II